MTGKGDGKGTKKKPKAKVKIKERLNPASKKKVELLIRQNLVLQLREQGGSYRRIAEQLKEIGAVNDSYSEGLAYKDAMDGLKRLIAEQRELATENLRLDLLRLDTLLSKAWTRAAPTGNMPFDLQAMGMVLQIFDRRERLLNYKSLHIDPTQKHVNFTIDWDNLTEEQLVKIRNGEDPIIVLSEPSQSKE